MKTKAITLILTLLFCLSGAVVAEEKYEYKPLSELLRLEADGSKLTAKLHKIAAELLTKTFKTADVSEQNHLRSSLTFLNSRI